MSDVELAALRTENGELREQLDDLAGEARTSPRLALKYWAHWRRARGELRAALGERDLARRTAVHLEQENTRLEHELAREKEIIVTVADAIPGPPAPAGDARPNTPDRVLPGGGRRITVKRCCNGCDRELGDATEAEITAAISGARLPDVRKECGCDVE